MKTRLACLLGVLACVTLTIVPAASASTFCVPTFTAECPSNGQNVQVANLETAMGMDASDGIPDRILIGTHTYTDPGTLEPAGTDPLEVLGSGTEKTFVTSSLVGGNDYVVNLNSGSRTVDMSDLTIVIPASFTDDSGSGLQAEDGTFDRVNIESRNPDSDGAPSLIGDTVWRDSRIYGANGGSIDFALAPNSAGSPGRLQIIRTEIEDAAWGVRVGDSRIPVEFRQSRITDPVAYAIRVSDGGQLSVENSVIETGGQEGISVATDSTPTDPDISVVVRNSNFVNTASLPVDPAIKVEIGAGFGSRSAAVTVSESIFSGFENNWQMITPAGPGIGQGSLTLSDSNFSPVGLPDDSPAVDFSDPGNINADPLFAGPGDYRLLPGSPSIDGGGGGPAGPLVDFIGAVRPRDGDGDGIARRDQGAFERPDTSPPKISRLKAKKLKNGGIRIRYRLSEAARVKFTFKPVPANSGGKKRKAPVIRGKAKRGANTLLVKAGRLSKGRYRLKLVARDPYGNASSKTIKARAAARRAR